MQACETARPCQILFEQCVCRPRGDGRSRMVRHNAIIFNSLVSGGSGMEDNHWEQAEGLNIFVNCYRLVSNSSFGKRNRIPKKRLPWDGFLAELVFRALRYLLISRWGSDGSCFVIVCHSASKKIIDGNNDLMAGCLSHMEICAVALGLQTLQRVVSPVWLTFLRTILNCPWFDWFCSL